MHNAFKLYNEQSSNGLKLYHSQLHKSGPRCTILIQISTVLNHILGLVKISCSNFPSYCLIQSASSVPKICDPWQSARLLHPACPKLGMFSVHVTRGFGNWAEFRTDHIWQPPLPENAKLCFTSITKGTLEWQGFPTCGKPFGLRRRSFLQVLAF
jgi:hypothetical protein